MTDHPTPTDREEMRVVIVGGGVAALEALIALRALAPGRIAPVLISATDKFVYRPMLVGEPFGHERARHFSLADICSEFGAELIVDRVTEVLPVDRAVRTARGRAVEYESLLLATGARPYAPFEHGVTFEREVSPEDFDDVLAELTDGTAPHVAIVVPDGVSWTLPAYELALLTAAWAERHHPDRTCVTIVTHERAPVAGFGTVVSDAVRELLEHERIALRCGVHPDVMTPTALRIGGAWLSADRIVSLPLLSGPRIPGLPADSHGFIPVDALGRVQDLEGVYAAGDSGTFAIKQGGLAAQQGEAVATHIAAVAGADIEPRPFEPVLRGVLMTGQGPRFLRAELRDVESTSTISSEPLWWPPSRIASHWLGPYLAHLSSDASLASTPGVRPA